jgi:hypothetical protein
MATVCHTYDPHFGRDVAIKVLPREFLHDPAAPYGRSSPPSQSR